MWLKIKIFFWTLWPRIRTFFSTLAYGWNIFKQFGLRLEPCTGMALLIFCTNPSKGTYFSNALATRALTDMKHQKMLLEWAFCSWKCLTLGGGKVPHAGTVPYRYTRNFYRHCFMSCRLKFKKGRLEPDYIRIWKITQHSENMRNKCQKTTKKKKRKKKKHTWVTNFICLEINYTTDPN
jgi:hypothetical protein